MLLHVRSSLMCGGNNPDPPNHLTSLSLISSATHSVFPLQVRQGKGMALSETHGIFQCIPMQVLSKGLQGSSRISVKELGFWGQISWLGSVAPPSITRIT